MYYAAAMFKVRRDLLASAATLCLAIVGLTGCGGGSSSEVVAQVGATPITKAGVSHWMSTLAGGDYYELSAGHTVPDGLVSEPANYGQCVNHLTAAASAIGGTHPTGAQLLAKCRQLYQAMKVQALAYIVEAQWRISADKEAGVTVSDQEVVNKFASWRAQSGLVSDVALQQYLARRRRTRADELLVLKLDLLSQKVQEKVTAGGKPAFAKLIEDEQSWATKTDCHAGYVVRHCKQYTEGGPIYASLPPSILMEQVAALVTGRCTNRPACAKQ